MSEEIRKAFEAWWVTFDITPDLNELRFDEEKGYYIDFTTQRMYAAFEHQQKKIDENIDAVVEEARSLINCDATERLVLRLEKFAEALKEQDK